MMYLGGCQTVPHLEKYGQWIFAASLPDLNGVQKSIHVLYILVFNILAAVNIV